MVALARFIIAVTRRVASVAVSAFVLGLSLLPLAALLMAFPAVIPEESVLADTLPPARNRMTRFARRGFALLTAFAVLITLLALAVEIVGLLNLKPTGQFGYIARSVLSFQAASVVPPNVQATLAPESLAYLQQPVHALLPPVMVEHWPHVMLVIYLLDLVLLFAMGKVPLQYNARNLIVRWRITGLTALAFFVVVALMVAMLAFVNGMNNLTENSGVPGNVFILSDGATDEIFSNLGYGELDNVERAVTVLDDADRPLAVPVGVRKDTVDGKDVFWASRETYYILNQPILDPQGRETGRRRFIQLRTMEDGEMGGKVHGIALAPGGRWFSDSAIQTRPDQTTLLECVLGAGLAETLGLDIGKRSLTVGDTFNLGNIDWVVVGVMQSQGSTFASELWTKRTSRIYEPFGKKSYTTLIVRTDADTAAAARNLAKHLSTRYTQQKLKAVSEQQYYSELNKTNRQFLFGFSIVALVLSIGSIFGVMNTMFAAIAQRIRDIGVLRLLGFKRWQILVSFMIESLLIAIVGGALGCLIGFAIDGRSATSTVSGGSGPGGRSVVLTIDVSTEIIVCGLLFTLVIGRLGGLVPALSAIRVKILDSLR
jgi:putative ABC transport system permease protein